MATIFFFIVVLVSSLVLNISIKTKQYNRKHRSIWAEGDSVCITGLNDDYNTSFMQRIA